MDSKTSRANRRKGADFEIKITDYLRGLGYRADRLTKRGSKDEGDVAVDLGGKVIVIEAKDEAKHNLSGYVAESQTEARRYAEARGLAESNVIPLVVIKRRMKGVPQSYAVIELDTLTRIIGL